MKHVSTQTRQAAVLGQLRDGMVLFQQNRLEEAENKYRHALALHPNHPEALHLLGLVMAERGQADHAAQLIEQSLHIQPNNPVAWNNLGNIHRTQTKWSQALTCYDRALALKPDHYLALSGRGAATRELNQPQVARQCYRLAMNDPRLKDVCRAAALQVEMELCDWTNASEIDLELREAIHSGRHTLSPFPILAMLDDPEGHLLAASTFGQTRAPSVDVSDRNSFKPTGNKIRIGYFSADFHHHATALLMAELFECHDRQGYEWHGFSFGPDKNDGMRQRLTRGFDHFHDIRHLSDADAAAYARRLGIDVAVDLKGYTKDSRLGIFTHRAAPIQVNYLGYPGSMGVPYIDYVLADPVIIPDEALPLYSEKVVRLPRCYQPNDRSRPLPSAPPNRHTFGLPEQDFVFCCFNNNYKITPSQFALWIQILHRVPRSVLWLYVTQGEAIDNLQASAARAGIDPQRLIFATNAPHAIHLSRYTCADLFLDTFPCNAHTTASDALWMGLPLVTLQGRSFASRVAASLLRACDLPELITTDARSYVELAVSLATQPQRLQELRQRLCSRRSQHMLFDTPALARSIESAYLGMVTRWRKGLPPEHFDARP